MNSSRSDQLARAAVPVHDRRTSLMTLGAAALGASLLNPSTAEARKRGKRNTRKKRCQKDQKQCRRAARNYCRTNEPDLPECEELLRPCCRKCKAKTALVCVLNLIKD